MVEISSIRKSFGKQPVLSDVSLSVKKGEIFFLLGPSGCGKSTLLRIVAGLEPSDRGTVSCMGKPWNGLPAEERGVGMVFQQYSLWPHMTVLDNVSYGLKLRKVNTAERKTKAMEALKRVGLEAHALRKPGTLSGGEQQRAAIARALVLETPLILLDEPLSNLDARLRVELRTEIKALQRELGLTLIYVTHDQEETMAIADRMAIMNEGRVVQVGTPEEVYSKPVSRFAAEFFGSVNLFPGHNGTFRGVRPHETVVRPLAEGMSAALSGRVKSREFRGDHALLRIDSSVGVLLAHADAAGPQEGEEVIIDIGDRGFTIPGALH